MLPFKGLLVEGTSGAGKSTLIDALIRSHVNSAKARKIRSLVHLAQSHTYGPLAVAEDHGALSVATNQLHVDRVVRHMEWLHASVQEHDKPWCFALLDTLHLTHCVRPGVVCWKDVAEYDRRLAGLGFKLLLLKVELNTNWEHGILPRVNEQFIQVYTKKFGRSHEEIHQYFVREQEILAELFSRSAMPKLMLSNDGDMERLSETARQFWLEDPDGAGLAAGSLHREASPL